MEIKRLENNGVYGGQWRGELHACFLSSLLWENGDEGDTFPGPSPTRSRYIPSFSLPFFWCIWLLILWSQFSDAKWKDEGNECLQGIFYGSDCMIFKKWGGLDVFFYWDVEDLRTIFSICICDAWKMEFWTACLTF